MSRGERSMTDRDFDALLGAWFSEGAQDAPDRIAERAVAAAVDVRQERPWLMSFHASNGLVLAAAAAALVLALGIAAAVGLPLIGDDDAATPSASTAAATPQASASTPPSAASAAPSAGADTHLSSTPVGTIRWTRVTVPTAIYPWSAADGLVRGRGDDGFWVSGDGVTWTPADPDPIGDDGELIGTEWALVSPDGVSRIMGPVSAREIIARPFHDGPGSAQVMHRVGDEWVAESMPPSELAVGAGIEVTAHWFQQHASLDQDHWIAAAVRQVQVPWADIYGTFDDPMVGEEVGPRTSWDETDQVLTLLAPGGDAGSPALSVARLSVELVDGDPPQVVYRDSETGELVHTLEPVVPGWSTADVAEAMLSWGLEDVRLLVHDGTAMRFVTPPWPAHEEFGDLVSALGRYYAVSYPIGDNYEALELHLWESADGVTWNLARSIPPISGTLDHVALAGNADKLLMAAYTRDQSPTLWVSTDARSWTPSDTPVEPMSGPQPTDFGWLLQGYDSAAISADGRAWETLDLPPLPGEPFVRYLGGRFFYGPELASDGSGDYEYWLGALDP